MTEFTLEDIRNASTPDPDKVGYELHSKILIALEEAQRAMLDGYEMEVRVGKITNRKGYPSAPNSSYHSIDDQHYITISFLASPWWIDKESTLCEVLQESAQWQAQEAIRLKELARQELLDKAAKLRAEAEQLEKKANG